MLLATLHDWQLQLQKHNPDTASLGLIRHILRIHTSIDRCRSPIVQVMMQLAVSSSEFKLLEKQWVVVQSQCIEDIEFSLQTR